MPMAAEVGSGAGHDHDVADTGHDVPVATGTAIALDGLIWLNAVHFDIVQPMFGPFAHSSSAQTTRPMLTSDAAATKK